MILKPIMIRNIQIRNRIVMPPMKTGRANDDGTVSDDLIRYYKLRARRLGLVITEHHYIRKDGIASANQVSVSRDSDICGLSKIARAVHEEGTKILMQLNHAGSASTRELAGEQVKSASAVIRPSLNGRIAQMPRPLTGEEIRDLTVCFGDAACRAKEAGYDGVEIHSAHGYLLNQFFSPLTNRREDAYNGQTIEGRIRFQREVLREVRSRTGTDFLIALRLGGCDYSNQIAWRVPDCEGNIVNRGSTIDDAVKAARIFEQDGDLDLLDLSGGMCGYVIPGRQGPGYMKDLSSGVKAACRLPVILTGGVNTADEADTLLQENAADLIGIGRAIFADEDWALKNIQE